MFDIGFWELFILFGIGLIVLGPERLPRVAMKVGQWAGHARRTARTLTSQLRSELDLDQNIGGYKPRKAQTYSRPGVDDLKPGQADGAQGQAPADGPAAPAQASTDTAATSAETPPQAPANAPAMAPDTPARTD
jgi:sec-independent protein translocase protein TatB